MSTAVDVPVMTEVEADAYQAAVDGTCQVLGDALDRAARTTAQLRVVTGAGFAASVVLQDLIPSAVAELCRRPDLLRPLLAAYGPTFSQVFDQDASTAPTIESLDDAHAFFQQLAEASPAGTKRQVKAAHLAAFLNMWIAEETPDPDPVCGEPAGPCLLRPGHPATVEHDQYGRTPLGPTTTEETS
jgi:hypothetical protein